MAPQKPKTGQATMDQDAWELEPHFDVKLASRLAPVRPAGAASKLAYNSDHLQVDSDAGILDATDEIKLFPERPPTPWHN